MGSDATHPAWRRSSPGGCPRRRWPGNQPPLALLLFLVLADFVRHEPVERLPFADHAELLARDPLEGSRIRPDGVGPRRERVDARLELAQRRLLVGHGGASGAQLEDRVLAAERRVV